MSQYANTIFLRLAGPMQSWGTSSRFQLRQTDLYPSKSGVMGMILCAMGTRRESSQEKLKQLTSLLMGVRVDRQGITDWDYHTAGAKIGIRSADGKIKKTATTGEFETLLSRRQYLYDASFLVALQGSESIIEECVNVLENPSWPLFLGRKSCIPSEPVFAGIGCFDNLRVALSSVQWKPRIPAVDGGGEIRAVEVYLEHPSGERAPDKARLVYDVPRIFGHFNYGARWVINEKLEVSVGNATQVQRIAPLRGDPYSEHFKKVARPTRLELDNHLCVFCKSPAEEMHHISYENCGHETNDHLRSLCKLCHDACTILEYSSGMNTRRVDPSDPDQRQMIFDQIGRLLNERRHGRRRELLENIRAVDFFSDATGLLAGKD